MDDPGSQDAYDRIARLAQQRFGIQTVLIGFDDGERHWFKSRIGTTSTEVAARNSPGAPAVAGRRTIVVEDAQQNVSIAAPPMLTEGFSIRFYAAAPLLTYDGHAIGTLCLFDPEPRAFGPADRAALEDFAQLVMTQLKADREIGRLDPASRLPNRLKLLLDLQAVARRDPNARRLLVLVDLMSARQVDETIGALGMDLFNELVRRAAGSLRTTLTRNTQVYHLGAAQLAFILNDDGRDPFPSLEKAVTALREPMPTTAGIPVTLRPCVGVRRIGLAEMTAPDVLRTVFSAARQARATETSFAWYDTAEDIAQKRAFGLLSDFPSALRSPDQLHLLYQPRIDLASGKCVSAEALLRWNHPELGAIAPLQFFPLVEKTGLIRQVTDFVMREAVAQVAAWDRDGFSIGCSINISARNLHEDDFVDRLYAVLMKEDVDPARIEIEIVEDADLGGSQTAALKLEQIRRLGVGIAIDDFGSGYSNISYLLSLPASTLKIDRSLIAGILHDRTSDIAVSSIIDLGHKLGYRIVAEGIEDTKTYTQLKERGCDEVQGYFISRALAPDDLLAWLETSDHAPNRQRIA